jgi:nucleoside-diphosphate-sugar epimerase
LTESTGLHLLITGGAGFLGSRLARELLATGQLAAGGEPAAPIAAITLADVAPPPADLVADARVRVLRGDLRDLLTIGGAGWQAVRDTHVIFHLAAAVSGECEADFDLGIRANLRATEALLAACRTHGTAPVVVFSSSIAVFGGSPAHPLPAVVTDQTLPDPQSSYGTQKVMSEYLLADYTRKGFLRGRTVRLATVAVRPGRPNAAASGFLSGILREPLAGQRAVCPVAPETAAVIASPDKAVAALLCAARSAADAWGGGSPVNMAALTVTVAEMVAALERAAGPAAAGLIDWVPDPQVARLVTSWPARVQADRAIALGLSPDPDVDSIIAQHLAQRGR